MKAASGAENSHVISAGRVESTFRAAAATCAVGSATVPKLLSHIHISCEYLKSSRFLPTLLSIVICRSRAVTPGERSTRCTTATNNFKDSKGQCSYAPTSIKQPRSNYKRTTLKVTLFESKDDELGDGHKRRSIESCLHIDGAMMNTIGKELGSLYVKPMLMQQPNWPNG